MKLIVGLGNPGRQYERTRHNLGFRVVDLLAARWNVPMAEGKFSGWWGRTTVAGEPAGLLKPATFVNCSGRAVAEAVRFYKVSLPDLLVIVDDLDLPVGRIRIKPKGSAGGHRGLEDIIGRLGSNEFARVRIGIDKPADGDSVRYVLGEFAADEEPLIERAVARAADAADCWLREGLDAAMNKYNRPPCDELDERR